MAGTPKGTNLDDKVDETGSYDAGETEVVWADDHNDLAATANDLWNLIGSGTLPATDKHALIGDGDHYVSRVLVEDDISDLGSVKGSYTVFFSPWMDSASNSNGAGGSWGGGNARYITGGTGGQPSYSWDLGKFVPQTVAGNSVTIDKVRLYFWYATTKTGQLNLVAYDVDRTGVNDGTVFSSTSTTWVSVASSTYYIEVNPAETLTNLENYTIFISSLADHTNTRIMGGYIDYTVN